MGQEVAGSADLTKTGDGTDGDGEGLVELLGEVSELESWSRSRVAIASSSVMSAPPITFIRAPVAPVISTSSKGLLIAFSTASIALFSVSDSPTPIIATPPLPITVFISA